MDGRTPTFSELFKKFRLKSGFATLAEFGKKLADEGLIFEDSLFSRWQNGNRVPKDRKTLLKILKVFIDNSGINSLKEANAFLESAGQGYLTEKEQLEFLPPFKSNLSLPDKLTQGIDEENFSYSINSVNSWNEKYYLLENHIYLLYELIYQGDPFTAYRRLKNIEKYLSGSELKDKRRSLNLLSQIHWISLRCLSDICKPGRFYKGIAQARTYLSFALEKNSQTLGSLYWMNSALMRLQIVTMSKERLPKSFIGDCLRLAELSLLFTPKQRLAELLVSHIEIAKIALLIEDKLLFDKHLQIALEIIAKLPSKLKHFAVMVWDVKARGSLKFGGNIDSALENIQTAKAYTDEKYLAANLYLRATEFQALKISHDPKLLKRAERLKHEISFISDLLENPYQKFRIEKGVEYAGV